MSEEQENKIFELFVEVNCFYSTNRVYNNVTLPVSRPEVRVAMRPITVRSPVHTTIPRAVPEETGEVTEIRRQKCVKL